MRSLRRHRYELYDGKCFDARPPAPIRNCGTVALLRDYLRTVVGQCRFTRDVRAAIGRVSGAAEVYVVFVDGARPPFLTTERSPAGHELFACNPLSTPRQALLYCVRACESWVIARSALVRDEWAR